MTRVVVTGTGQCGTKYMARVLGVGHQQVYNLRHDEDWSKATGGGESSMHAVPHLDGFDGYVIHVVRNPLAFVNGMSRHTIHSWGDTKLRDYEPEVFQGRGVDKAMGWWVQWNKRIEPYADIRVRVEDVALDDLAVASGHLGKGFVMYENEPTIRTNGRAGMPGGPWFDELMDQAARYGYEVPA